MPGRNFTASNYRYDFNGKESDKQSGWNTQDYGFRNYDPRLGRFFSIDPLAKFYPENSPYSFAGNTPIVAIDLEGLEIFAVHGTWSNSKTWEALNNENWKSIKEATGNKNVIFYNWLHYDNSELNDLEGPNSDYYRKIAAWKLAIKIAKEHKPNEPITLVGHSHGGNVAILAINILKKAKIKVDYLITINTPVREYKLDDDIDTKHFHIYHENDKVQRAGSAPSISLGDGLLKPSGEISIGYFKREFDLNGYTRNLGLPDHGDMHNTHNHPEIWRNWLKISVKYSLLKPTMNFKSFYPSFNFRPIVPVSHPRY